MHLFVGSFNLSSTVRVKRHHVHVLFRLSVFVSFTSLPAAHKTHSLSLSITLTYTKLQLYYSIADTLAIATQNPIIQSDNTDLESKDGDGNGQ